MTDMSTYAKALFELAAEENICEHIKNELSEISSIIEKNPRAVSLFDCAGINIKNRKTIISDCFKGVHEYIMNLLYILTEKRRMHLFLKCVSAYNKYYDNANGIQHVTAVTAVSMTEEEKTKLVYALQKKRGVKIALENVIDPSILGGIILRFPDSQTDASLLGRLKKAKYDLHKEKNYGY